MGYTKPYKWEFSKMAKHRDTIVSSDYVGKAPFVASFQAEKDRVNMFHLLSMEYSRIWYKELRKFQEAPVIKPSESKPELIRPQVMRSYMRVKRQQTGEKEPFFMKRFKNIPAKTNSYLHQCRGLKKENVEKIKEEIKTEIQKEEIVKKTEKDDKPKRCNIWRRHI